MAWFDKLVHSLALGLIALLAKLCAPAPMDDAEARIQQLRTREVTLELRDAAGRPLADVPLAIDMTRHEFLFGGNLFLLGGFEDTREELRYRELFADVFNFATLPFYLGMHEADGSRRDGDRLRQMVEWGVERRIALKGHPLVWHFPSTMPDWLPSPTNEVEQVHRERIDQILGEWRGRIGYWDVVNEPTIAWLFESPVSDWHREAGPVAVTRDALAWAREADPEGRLIVNEVNVGPGPWHLLALGQPRRAMGVLFGSADHHFGSFRSFVGDLLAAGAPIDGIGLQAHMHTGTWPLNLVWRTCERHADLGLPLHWSETTVLSGEPKIIRPDDPDWRPEWPSTPEGEAAQAEYVHDLYTLLFSHPAVASITWWDLSDRDAWMGAPAGLVRADLSPKPAYEALLDLVRDRWWTRAIGRSDAEGRFRLRGFCGDYRLTSGAHEASTTFRIECSRPDGERIPVAP